MIDVEQLTKAADQLELFDRSVIVHAALRSFGEPIDGGADTLLDLLLARGCTVLVPAFTEPQFMETPPATMRPARNGIDYTSLPTNPSTGDAPVFDVTCGLINPRLGVFPATVVNRYGLRGNHPLNSFAAIGPRATDLITPQHPTDVYGPLRALAAHDGAILLIGVGLNRMTAIHLAEQQSGRRLFVRWARNTSGQIDMVEVGSCSEGFPRLKPILRPYERSTTVGLSTWQAYPAKQVLDTATATITANPTITHCPNNTCLSCQDATAGGPLGPPPFQPATTHGHDRAVALATTHGRAGSFTAPRAARSEPSPSRSRARPSVMTTDNHGQHSCRR